MNIPAPPLGLFSLLFVLEVDGWNHIPGRQGAIALHSSLFLEGLKEPKHPQCIVLLQRPDEVS